jgi:hypothetical protein
MYPKSDSDCSASQLIERHLVRTLVDELLGQGLWIAVDDGEDTHPVTNDRDTILDELMETDCDRVNIYYQENNLQPSYQGQIFLVYGNDGWDVLSDYSVSVEHFITKTNDLAQRIGDQNDNDRIASLIRQGNL